MRHDYRWAILALACLPGACGGGDVGTTLGLGRSAPDEYRVVSHPELSVPPAFALTPPGKAGEAGQAQTQPPGARLRAILRQATPPGSKPTSPRSSGQTTGQEQGSGATQAWLERLGTSAARSDIREILAEESATKAERMQKRGLLEQLRQPYVVKEPVVAPGRERERLLENQRRGAPVSRGEVPTRTPKEGPLDGWW